MSRLNRRVKLGLSRNLWFMKSYVISDLNPTLSWDWGKLGHLHKCGLSADYENWAYFFQNKESHCQFMTLTSKIEQKLIRFARDDRPRICQHTIKLVIPKKNPRPLHPARLEITRRC